MSKNKAKKAITRSKELKEGVVTVQIETSIRERLDLIAERRDVTRSHVIREAVKKYLEDPQIEAVPA
ncbi:MAG TPA: ribbon-helix-helix protein, CopG family [Candidatus Acidoferrum sp.]|jgi:predicted transcriptional regulator|nr:ribbon-helix-helix protein, CopG family [Candidatus Acidoferrum sp.]